MESDVVWLDKASNVLLSADGLTLLRTTGGFGSARANVGRKTGKRVFEIEITVSAGSSRYGIGDASFALTSYLGTAPNALGAWALYITPISGAFSRLGTDVHPGQAVGSRYQILVDFNSKKGWIRHNGVYRTPGADPANGIGADFTFTVTSELFPAASSYNPGDAMRLRTKLSEFSSPIPAGFISWAEENEGTPPPPPPPPSGQIGVGLLGDSITWYMDQPPFNSTALLNFTPTFNAGAGSATTAAMLTALPNLITFKPKAIFILGGVNDYPLGLSREQTRDNIVAMVNACMAADVIPYVEGILPVAPNYTLYGGATVMNAEAAARNAMIRAALLPLKGGQWIDWGSTLTGGDWQGDGIHLTAAGYAKMYAALSPYLNLYR